MDNQDLQKLAKDISGEAVIEKHRVGGRVYLFKSEYEMVMLTNYQLLLYRFAEYGYTQEEPLPQ